MCLCPTMKMGLSWKIFYLLSGRNNQQLTSTTTEVVVLDDGLAFF